MLITLSGQDGSGKSFLADLLDSKYKVDGRRVFRFEYKAYFFINWFVLCLKENSQLGIIENNLKKTDDKRRLRSLERFWPYLVFITDMVFYHLVMLPLSAFFVVISDRYIYDRIIGFYNLGILSSVEKDLFLFLCPKPANSFVLLCSPELSLKRETDEKHHISFYSRLNSFYKSFSSKYNVKTLDTSFSASEVLANLLDGLD